MKIVIASDFHLKINENEFDIERRLRIEKFLKSLIGNIDCLILAGDIFDLWIEWNTVIVKNYFSILSVFAQLKDSGCRLVYIAGNHDFWLEKFLKNDIGFETYDGDFTADFNNKKIFVSHGDLYTKNDIRYKVFRRVIRSKIVKYITKLIHPDISLKIGQLMSRSSRKKVINDKKSFAKELGLKIKAESLSDEYDLIVFGHSHNPKYLKINNSIYINTGDWINQSSY